MNSGGLISLRKHTPSETKKKKKKEKRPHTEMEF